MFSITITFRVGPTILEHDSATVQIRRAAHTEAQVNSIQKAALALDALDVQIVREHKN